jgi:sterol desaturase/sphingolipid hydroxylase (fatty acid hydroxylase superfamily)
MNPAEHKVHHGIEERHFDCNYGLALRCWDVWFGTYRAPDTAMDEIAVGVAEHEFTDRTLVVQAQTLKYLTARPAAASGSGSPWPAALDGAVDAK